MEADFGISHPGQMAVLGDSGSWVVVGGDGGELGTVCASLLLSVSRRFEIELSGEKLTAMNENGQHVPSSTCQKQQGIHSQSSVQFSSLALPHW